MEPPLLGESGKQEVGCGSCHTEMVHDLPGGHGRTFRRSQVSQNQTLSCAQSLHSWGVTLRLHWASQYALICNCTIIHRTFPVLMVSERDASSKPTSYRSRRHTATRPHSAPGSWPKPPAGGFRLVAASAGPT